MSELDILLEALNISPDNNILRKHVAKMQFDIGSYEEAYDNYRLLYENQDDDLEILESMVKCMLRLENYDEVKKLVQDKIEEDWPFGMIALSKCLFYHEEYDEAMKDYEKAVDIMPELEDDDYYKELLKHTSSQKVKLRVINFRDDKIDDDDFVRPQISFKDVGGMKNVKESIKVNIIYPLKNNKIFQAYGKKAGGGILLYGPPGCGKTFIAMATAGECEAYFTNITITDILDMYIGESEKNLHSIFEAARRKKPSIIFIDEIDAIGGKRQASYNNAGRSITNQLLMEMDSTQNNNEDMLIIGATNTPWSVDSALKRPGRFDRILLVPPPDFEARIEIIKLNLKDKPCINIDYEAISKKMIKYSGADIKAVCDAASEAVIKVAMEKGKIIPIKTSDILNALKVIKPSTLEWLNTAKNYATYSNQSGIYDEILEYLKTDA